MKTLYTFALGLLLILGSCSKKDSTPTPVTKSADKDITGFNFGALNVTSSIDGGAKTISAAVQSGTNRNGLVPTITVSAKAAVSPGSEVAQDFTNVVTYTVTAEDGSTQAYKVTVSVNKPAYQIAIEAKAAALGWTSADNGGVAVQTAAKKGWVQYYGSKDRAIYYYPADGAFAGGAFGMLILEMKKYDARGQDNFAYVSSDPKLTTGNGYYNEIIEIAGKTQGILVSPPTSGKTYAVYGNIYAKYLALNRWDGPLGFSTNDESPLNGTVAGRYNNFTKGSSNGAIVFNGDIGTQAVWGKIYTLWGATNFDSGWLRLPTGSCDPNKVDNDQGVKFQNGIISNPAGCGKYFDPLGTQLIQNGSRPSVILGVTLTPPCY